MRQAIARPVIGFGGQSLCISCRRAGHGYGYDGLRQPGFRPLHASPIFQRTRRRDFFSSNRSLLNQTATRQDGNKEKADPGVESSAAASIQKRKTARSPGTKTSLRRVGLEAQRSKAGLTRPGQKTMEGTDQTLKLVTAYAVADQFDLTKVVEILRSKGYEPDPLETGLFPQVVHVQIPISSIYRSTNPAAAHLSSTEVGDVFVFPSGTLVTWALPDGFTSYFATRTLLPAADNPHKEPIETEDLDYIEDSSREHSLIRGDTIILGTKRPEHHDDEPADQTKSQFQSVDTVLTKIAFSSGFARSTKLAVLETNLSTYLASTADIPALLSKGSRLPFKLSRDFILRKTGQLLLLRAQLNLYSELTDSLPDLFWDSRHELNLENYYDQVGRALDVGIRIKVLNEKMDYAAEIATVLRERLSEKHGLFLEWTIIVLIAVEVGFEVLRLWKEGFWAEVWEGRVGEARGKSI
ncbi:hypothetical protein A1O7_03852 [Cladophialophora yegresii CBS 114405]|uniref:DUF155 domain-containing protein n=1 Tax=Cladophialophora yegresii CBS 114405 TaxID=1182544 RepID=W9W593_9EURO|nr:uncharacterized protein A1O7_03852 [Cladophialophora yegresii CBS 114405]EXJ59706.1 hypothetical protein A1O7_03852 [Cladophialophora yegresii CBS 114405]